MTKREKILLQICIAVGLVGFGGIYLLRPSISEKKEAMEALEVAQMQEIQVMTILSTSGVEEELAKQKKLAEQNYKYFYDKLDSYTIDEILNKLVAGCKLDIESMEIGQYGKMDISTLKRMNAKEVTITEGKAAMQSLVSAAYGEEEEEAIVTTEQSADEKEESDFLLGCRVKLKVYGTYDKFLDFLSAVKKESTCIEIASIDVHTSDQNVIQERAVSATVELLVYGIEDTMVEGKDK